MRVRHGNVFFYAYLSLMLGVNVILGYALYSHFVLDRPVAQIEWLLGIFVTQILGNLAFTWKKVTDVPDSVEPVPNATDNNGLQVINQETAPLVIQKVAFQEVQKGSNSDADLAIKKKGDDHLVLARDERLTIRRRKQHANMALDAYAQIDKNSSINILVVYQIGTAYRQLGNYAKAIHCYEEVKEVLSEKGSSVFSEAEICRQISDAEMMIGTVLQKQGLQNEARERFLHAWKISPRNFVALLNLFDLACEQKNLAEAEMWAGLLSTYDEYSSFFGLVKANIESLRRRKRIRVRSPALNNA